MKTSQPHLAKLLALVIACTALISAPAPCHAASGRIYMFTASPLLETNVNSFTHFLQGVGYAVTVEQDPGTDPYEALDTATDAATLISQLTNNYDLIIISRNFGSATLASSANEIAIWNNLNVPILCCNEPYLRINRWNWVNTATVGQFSAPKDLTITDSAHPIVAGLNADLFVTNGLYIGGPFNADGSIPDGGTNMDVIARANLPPYNPPCIAVWDENAGEVRGFYSTSPQTYTRRRVFLDLPDWRTLPGDFGSVSFNGKLMVANVVAYAMTGQVPPGPPAIGNFSPGDGSQYNTTATTFSFQATSPQTIPTSGIQAVVNGQDVSGSLQFAGTPTSRQVSYPFLVSNQVYNISITVSNALGKNLASLQFDTFDFSSVQVLYPDFDNTYTGPFTGSAYRLFVQLQTATPQVVSLTQSNASELPPAARLKAVFYLPGSMTTAQLIPLTDALGNQMILRMPNDTVTFIPGPLTSVTLSSLYLVPVVNPPSTILPTLGQASPYPGQAGVSPVTGLSLDLISGDAPVVPGSVQLFVDSANVTTASQTTIAGTVSGANAQYSPPNFLAPGQAHTVKVVFADNAAHTVTNQYSFYTVQMSALPPILAVPISAAIFPGFNLLISMAPSNTDNVFTNFSSRAELQLAGQLVGPSGPVTNAISGTTHPSPYLETNFINYTYDGNPPVPSGQGLYPTLPGWTLFPFSDVVLPASPANMAIAATTWLKLPAGVVTFGVSSAAGFLLTGGYDSSLVLGVYEGGRGAQVPTESQVLVYQPGLYPVRLLHYSGGGPALEFYTANNANAVSTSGRVLVNGTDDSTTTVPVPAYAVVKPTLNVAKSGSQAIISWNGAGNFQLWQKQSSLLSAGGWSLVGQTPVVQGWLHTVTVTLPASGSTFYRLELAP